MKADLGRDGFRPPLGAVNVRPVQQGLETEGLAVVCVCMQFLGSTRCNGSGCGSCCLNGKGWWAVKADSGSFAEQLQRPRDSESVLRLHDDVRSHDGDTAGPSQETLQGGVGQETVEGESYVCMCCCMCVCVRQQVKNKPRCVQCEDHVTW